MQVIRQPKTYDVCIIGSGAGWGMAAKVLCEAGADVVMLEAGGLWASADGSKMSAWPDASPRRGAAPAPDPSGACDGGSRRWEVARENATRTGGGPYRGC